MEREDRLFDVCSSVCGYRTPSIDPSLCGRTLLTENVQYDGRERVLVQLSAIRCLYDNLSQPQLDIDKLNRADFKEFSFKVVAFFSRHSQCLYQLLAGHLGSSDQFVSFAASKALVSLTLHTGVEALMGGDLFIKVKANLDTHVAVYWLQTIREVLKTSRKELQSTSQPRGGKNWQLAGGCLGIMSQGNCWQLTLQLFLNASTGPSGRLGVVQSLAEFLSLTIELLRHKSEVLSTDGTIRHLQQCIATDLSIILTVVEKLPSVFVVRRFVDVALKVGEVYSEEGIHFVVPALRKLFRVPIFLSVLYCWLDKYAEKLQLKISHSSQVVENLPTNENELIDISVRKTVLLVLKSVANLLKRSSNFTSNDSDDTTMSVCHGELRDLMISLWELLSECVTPDNSGGAWQYTGALYQVVSDEDGCLVNSLQASTTILRLTIGNPVVVESIPGLKTFLAGTNAHSLWLCFLSSAGFDYSMLLDLILTPEVDFASSLLDYLTLVSTDWSNFEETCKNLDHHQPPSSPVETSGGGSWSNASSDREDEGGLDEQGLEEDHAIALSSEDESLQTAKRQRGPTTTTTASLVDYSSSSSEEEEATTLSPPSPPLRHTGPLAPKVPCSSSQTASVLQIESEDTVCSVSSSSPCLSPSPLPPGPGLLEQAVGCLVRLRLSLERLRESELLPQNIPSSQLISAIEETEELYEKTL